MKIKATYGEDKPKLKKRRGDVIEYNPTEKVPLAVKDALAAQNGDGKIFWDEGVELEGDVQFSAKGDLQRGLFANNVYRAAGKVRVREHDAKRDELLPVKTKSFTIQFEDSLDRIGMPDLKVTAFELT